jgi:hypothetical protein
MGKYVCEIEGITTAAYLDVEGKYTLYVNSNKVLNGNIYASFEQRTRPCRFCNLRTLHFSI